MTWQVLRDRIARLLQSPRFVTVCLGLSVLVRVLWILLLDNTQVSDFAWYYQRGLEIAAGKGYIMDGAPTAFRPPGYSLFLGLIFALTGNSLLAAKLANVLLYAGILVLIHFYCRRFLEDEMAGRIALAILVFWPNQVAYSGLLASETLFSFLVVLSTLVLAMSRERVGMLILAGICCGLAVLVKAQALLIPGLLLLVYRGGWRSLLRSGVIVYLALLATLAPWFVRNTLVMGEPVLSTTGGLTLLMGNNPEANGTYYLGPTLMSLLQGDYDEVERDALARRLAVRYIVEHPARTVALWPAKLFKLLATDVEGISWTALGLPKPVGRAGEYAITALKALAQAYYLIALGLGFASLRSPQRKRRFYWTGWALAAYFCLVTLAFHGQSRFHFPLIPWMAIYAAVGVRLVLWRPSRQAARERPDDASR